MCPIAELVFEEGSETAGEVSFLIPDWLGPRIHGDPERVLYQRHRFIFIFKDATLAVCARPSRFFQENRPGWRLRSISNEIPDHPPLGDYLDVVVDFY